MKGIKLGKGIAAGILAMGVIHEVMTFTPYILDGMSLLSKESADVFICFSLGTGTSLILCGLLLLMLLGRTERYPFITGPVAIGHVPARLRAAIPLVYAPQPFCLGGRRALPHNVRPGGVVQTAKAIKG